jgi:hypothetical protein
MTTPMTTVRIARAERRIPPGEPLPVRQPTHVIVLADDAGHRELPLWLLGFDGLRLAQLFDRAAAARAPGGGTPPAGLRGPAPRTSSPPSCWPPPGSGSPGWTSTSSGPR